MGDTEVLLDDARSFAESAALQGSDVTVKEWSGVLHAWHAFFPILPKAEEALKEVTRFLSPLLADPDETDRAVPAAVAAPAVD